MAAALDNDLVDGIRAWESPGDSQGIQNVVFICGQIDRKASSTLDQAWGACPWLDSGWMEKSGNGICQTSGMRPWLMTGERENRSV